MTKEMNQGETVIEYEEAPEKGTETERDIRWNTREVEVKLGINTY